MDLLCRPTMLTSGLFLMGLLQCQALYLYSWRWFLNDLKKCFVRNSRCLLFMFVHVCVPVCNNRPLPGLCTYSRTKRPLYKYTRSATPRVQEKAREWKSDRAREKQNKKRLGDTRVSWQMQWHPHDTCTQIFHYTHGHTNARHTILYIYDSIDDGAAHSHSVSRIVPQNFSFKFASRNLLFSNVWRVVVDI